MNLDALAIQIQRRQRVAMSDALHLASYIKPGPFTGLGALASELDDVPADAGAVVAAVQNLLIHEGMTAAYGASFAPERAGEKQLHGAAAMLRRLKALSPSRLVEKRPPDLRLRVVCRHFATLFVAIMRRKGIPSRARCGFGRYFEPGKATDHWVGEYWNATEGRWILVDAQIDKHQRAFFNIGFDTLDVPRDSFLVAGDAWIACQNGDDPANYGVSGTENWGLVEICGNIFQDVAALQNIELLPWGWYGLALDEPAMLAEREVMAALADISRRADSAALMKLDAMLRADARLRPPLERVEDVLKTEGAA